MQGEGFSAQLKFFFYRRLNSEFFSCSGTSFKDSLVSNSHYSLSGHCPVKNKWNSDWQIDFFLINHKRSPTKWTSLATATSGRSVSGSAIPSPAPTQYATSSAWTRKATTTTAAPATPAVRRGVGRGDDDNLDNSKWMMTESWNCWKKVPKIWSELVKKKCSLSLKSVFSAFFVSLSVHFFFTLFLRTAPAHTHTHSFRSFSVRFQTGGPHRLTFTPRCHAGACKSCAAVKTDSDGDGVPDGCDICHGHDDKIWLPVPGDSLCPELKCNTGCINNDVSTCLIQCDANPAIAATNIYAINPTDPSVCSRHVVENQQATVEGCNNCCEVMRRWVNDINCQWEDWVNDINWQWEDLNFRTVKKLRLNKEI